jgi:hypothetical protein
MSSSSTKYGGMSSSSRKYGDCLPPPHSMGEFLPSPQSMAECLPHPQSMGECLPSPKSFPITRGSVFFLHTREKCLLPSTKRGWGGGLVSLLPHNAWEGLLTSQNMKEIFFLQKAGRMSSLWTPAYTPGDGQTSWVYSNNPVLHLYISCYVTVNKLVLS